MPIRHETGAGAGTAESERHWPVAYELKTPYRDGTTQLVFEPLDFMVRISAHRGRHFRLIADGVLV